MFRSITDLAIRHGILADHRKEEYRGLPPEEALKQIAVDTERRTQSRQDSASRELQLLRAIARECSLEVVDLEQYEPNRELFDLIAFPILFKHQIIPIDCQDGVLVIATSAPLDDEILAKIGSETGLGVDLALAESEQIRTFLKEHVGVAGATVGDMLTGDEAESSPEDLDEADAERLAQQSSVVKLVNELLMDAVESGASDIHIEPADVSFGIRYRIDGMLIDQTVPADLSRFHAAIVSRLKIMAKLNVAEKRLPQDGRIKIKVGPITVDIRISTIPMVHGESIVLRLLRQGGKSWGFGQLDMSPELEDSFRSIAQSPHGIFLVTGPTGSGKTTTLYNTLHELRVSRPQTKIITIEDPVEYSLPGVHQIQVNDTTGLTFARGLRSVLRHDPDVVLVGEIRDQETAKSAVQAALTGHLVVSTLHTNDSASAFTRLCEMGVEPYLVASTVRAVVAQRLVRRLCTHCKQVQSNTDNHTLAKASGAEKIYEALGCRECGESGYKGRMALFELLVSDEKIRDLCTQRSPAFEILEYAQTQGLKTLSDSGWECVRKGLTSPAEVARVAGV